MASPPPELAERPAADDRPTLEPDHHRLGVLRARDLGGPPHHGDGVVGLDSPLAAPGCVATRAGGLRRIAPEQRGGVVWVEVRIADEHPFGLSPMITVYSPSCLIALGCSIAYPTSSGFSIPGNWSDSMYAHPYPRSPRRSVALGGD